MYIQSGLLNLIVVLTGVLLLSFQASSLRGSALVAELKAKAKAALLAPTEVVEEVVTVENNSTGNATATNVTVVKTKSLLTGNPQKDYIYDPNLPRELNGYNLSDYPFYNSVPENITFKCDGLHDGFYASVPHKCQLYHHCLFGTRYDFLCANYTAFDQKTFICHFVSEIDCDNSPKHYDRNEALYKSASTAAPITTTTTTQRTTTSTQAPTSRPRRRRPYRRRRPAYDYYYDDEYDDEEYYDDEDIPPPPRRKMNRKHRPQHGSYHDEDVTDDVPETRDAVKPNVRPNGPTVSSVYARPRAPPKVRRPVPINERDKYEYKPPEDGGSGKDSQKNPRGQQKKQRVEDDEYYDDDDYEEEQPLPKKKNKPTDYHGESSSTGESHRPGSRFRQRQPNQRKHDRYEDEYDEDDRPTRPSRKQMRHEEYSRPSRPNRDRTNHRTHLQEDPKEAVPAERPGYISSDRFSSGSRKQTESESSRSRFNKKPARPVQEDDEEYYDDEEEEEVEDTKVTSRKNQRYGNSRGKDQAEYDYPEEAKGRSPNQERNRGKLDEKPVESPRTSSRSKERASPRVSGRTEPDGETTPIKSGSSSGRTVQKNNRKFSKPTVEVEDDLDDYEEEEYDEKPPQAPKRNNERFKGNTKQPSGQNRDSGSISSSEEPSDKVSITNPGVSSISPSNQNQGLVRGNFRNKNTKEESPTSTTTFRPSSSQYDDYDDKKSKSRPEGFLESKSRNNQPTYDKDQETTKVKMVTESKDSEYDDYSESTSRPVVQSSKSDDSYDRTSAPTLTRPSIGLFRRPTKITKSDTTTSSPTPNFRRPISDTSEDEIPQQRNGPTGSGQYLRRVKVETGKQENLSNPQPKFSNNGGYFKRLEKTPDSHTFDYLSDSQSQDGSQQLPLINNTNKYSENQPTRIGIKRVKLVDVQVRDTLRPSDDYKEIEPLPTTEESINNFNKPSAIFRPINDAKNKDESTKIPVTPSSALFRRPLKQRLKEASLVDVPTDSPLPKQSPPSEAERSYQRPESEAIVTFRSNKGYLNQNRGKASYEDDSARLVKNSNVDLLSRNPPNIDITAPGPSGGGIDSVPIRSDYRDSHTPSGFTLDIPDEEYDVTLNDALQPSTLHPTRSLVDYQPNRFKARGFQTTIPQPTGFSSRGTASFLTPAASQQYISQVQATNDQNRGTQTSGSDAYIEKQTNKGRQQTSDSQRYEALVLTAPANQQWINRNPRLTEWFW